MAPSTSSRDYASCLALKASTFFFSVMQGGRSPTARTRFAKRGAAFSHVRSTFKPCSARSRASSGRNAMRKIPFRVARRFVRASARYLHRCAECVHRCRNPGEIRPALFPGADDALEPSYGAPPSGPPRLPLPALSSEIERLLQRAEERSVQDIGPRSIIPAMDAAPSPDQEVDAVLPSEVLAALDEPLDEMDDDLESDSGLGTSVPRRVMGTPEVVTSSGHPPNPSESDEHAKHKNPKSKVRPNRGRRVAPSQPPVRRADGDPKEIETPRPPRRATSGPPPGIPSAPVSPRVPRSSTLPPSAHGSTSAGPPTIPPVSPRRIRPLMAGISPPAPPTDTPPEAMVARSIGPTPLPPRRSEASMTGRRTDALPSPETTTEAPPGVAPTELPGELGLGDALSAFAICVRERATGRLGDRCTGRRSSHPAARRRCRDGGLGSRR